VVSSLGSVLVGGGGKRSGAEGHGKVQEGRGKKRFFDGCVLGEAVGEAMYHFFIGDYKGWDGGVASERSRIFSCRQRSGG